MRRQLSVTQNKPAPRLGPVPGRRRRKILFACFCFSCSTLDGYQLNTIEITGFSLLARGARVRNWINKFIWSTVMLRISSNSRKHIILPSTSAPRNSRIFIFLQPLDGEGKCSQFKRDSEKSLPKNIQMRLRLIGSLYANWRLLFRRIPSEFRARQHFP